MGDSLAGSTGEQDGGELGGAEETHTSRPWREPESPCLAALGGHPDMGQELGKRFCF